MINKNLILEENNNKNVVVIARNFISENSLKESIKKELIKQNIPLTELKKENNNFIVGNSVFYIDKRKKIFKGILKNHNSFLNIDGLRIEKKDILKINKLGFETLYSKISF